MKNYTENLVEDHTETIKYLLGKILYDEFFYSYFQRKWFIDGRKALIELPSQNPLITEVLKQNHDYLIKQVSDAILYYEDGMNELNSENVIMSINNNMIQIYQHFSDEKLTEDVKTFIMIRANILDIINKTVKIPTMAIKSNVNNDDIHHIIQKACHDINLTDHIVRLNRYFTYDKDYVRVICRDDIDTY